MPFQNVPSDKQEKMHRCVLKIKETGKSEESAIAICYASVVEGQAAPAGLEELMREFTLDLSTFDMLTDLQTQETQPGKPFDGMRAGSFVDMRGTPVTFAEKDLAVFVSNTNAAIAATRTPGGEVVGLPIDAQNHNKGDAAGWIVNAELSGDVIRLTPKWTDLGLDLISSSRQRFFSPTVDLENKTIIGGSLTNWPATRAKGKTLLRPIELAEGDTNPMEEAIKQILEMLKAMWEKMQGAETPAPAPEPDMAQAATAAELTQARAQLAELTAQFERKAQVVEFAKRVTSGGPAGLNIPADKLTDVLLSLPVEKAAEIQALLENAVSVNFAEAGHAGKIKTLEPVPAEIAPYVRQWVEAGQPVEQFFVINPEVGPADRFDLSAFTPK